jgi:hypothetical protein
MTEDELLFIFEKTFLEKNMAMVYEIKKSHEKVFNNIEDLMFRAAVRAGNYSYVEEHVNCVDLNPNVGVTSLYLDEASDDSIRELLMQYGALMDLDEYDGYYSLAIDTVTDAVLSFTTSFQKQVFDKFMDVSGMSQDQLKRALEDEDSLIDTNLPEPLADYNLQDIHNAFRFIIKDEKVEIDTYGYLNEVSGWELKAIIEALGWEFEFEGVSWKLETNGVCYIS